MAANQLTFPQQIVIAEWLKENHKRLAQSKMSYTAATQLASVELNFELPLSVYQLRGVIRKLGLEWETSKQTTKITKATIKEFRSDLSIVATELLRTQKELGIATLSYLDTVAGNDGSSL